MSNPILSLPVQIYRRLTGAAGFPAGMLAGQLFHNEIENILYVGIGSNGLNGQGDTLAANVIKIAGVGGFVDLATAQVVAAKKTFAGGLTVPNGVSASDAAAFGQIAAALQAYATLSGANFTAGITVPTPGANDASLLVPNTAWVQNLLSQLAQGMQFKPTARIATAAALAVAYTYANGSSGVGATITGSANGALPAIDGVNVAPSDLVLVKNEPGAVNGLYVVTALGSGSAPFVLTRHADMDAAGEFSGALVPVGAAGAANGNSLWLCNPAGAVAVGSTAIAFTELNSATQLLAAATSGLAISSNSITIKGFAGVPSGALFKMSADGTSFAQAVAGTDYVTPFSSIDSGTA